MAQVIEVALCSFLAMPNNSLVFIWLSPMVVTGDSWKPFSFTVMESAVTLSTMNWMVSACIEMHLKTNLFPITWFLEIGWSRNSWLGLHFTTPTINTKRKTFERHIPLIKAQTVSFSLNDTWSKTYPLENLLTTRKMCCDVWHLSLSCISWHSNCFFFKKYRWMLTPK